MDSVVPEGFLDECDERIRALPKGRGVSKMKQHSFISERHDRVPQPKAKPSFGGMKPSNTDLRESQLAAPVADSECAPHQVGSPSSKSKDQKGNTAKLNYAVNQSAMRGDPAKTQDLLTNLENSGLESDATSYNLLMRAFCKANDIAGAEKVLERMIARGLKPNEYSFNTLMNAYAKSDDITAVEELMSRMFDSGVVVTGVSYAIAIHAWARHGDERRAESWLNRMIGAGIQPDCVNYNSLIHASSVNKDADG